VVKQLGFFHATIRVTLILALLAMPHLILSQDKPVQPAEIKPARKSNGEVFPLDNIYVELKKRRILKWLSKLSVSGSFGYGSGYFNQKPDALGIYQDVHGGPYYFTKGLDRPKAGYQNWLMNPVPVIIPADSAGQFLFRTDTTDFKFRGRSKILPFNLMVTFRLKNIRLGAGIGMDYMTRTTFTPVRYADSVTSFQSAKGLMSVMKYYAYGGYDFLRFDKIMLTGDMQVGKFFLKRNLNAPDTRTSLLINAGVTARYELSEYLSAFVRPAFELKRYTQTLAPVTRSAVSVGSIVFDRFVVSSGSDGGGFVQKLNTISVSVGLNYSIPQLPRCYIKTCQIQMNHAHGNKEYRSRMHPLFRKQNPGYGENYPVRVRTQKVKPK
jgi:hypothetical protein